MARAIVRYSLNSDSGSKYTNRIRGALQRVGFDRHGRTGALETRGTDLSKVVAAVKDALDVIDDLPPNVQLDHVWIYLDSDDE